MAVRDRAKPATVLRAWGMATRPGLVWLAVVLLAQGCGNGSPNSSQAAPRKDAGGAHVAEVRAPVEIAALPLGLADASGFRWRDRAGQAAYRQARAAEARGDWAAVVTACRAAVAADPLHLDAAWLLAAGLGRLGKHEELVAPLHQAVAGDFGKWADASLALPALQGFLATPTGEAWRRRLDADRAGYLAALAKAPVVIVGGELFAVDVDAKRWLRLTRTSGAVIAALRPVRDKLAYVTRTAKSGKAMYAIGVVELGHGTTTRTVALGTGGPITLSYSRSAPVGFWITGGTPRTTRRLTEDRTLVTLPAKQRLPDGLRLEIKGRAVTPVAASVPQVTADWDEHGLASAIRIAPTHRVVSAPSPGLICGSTVTWSPSGTHLAFVAQLDNACTPGALDTVAFVADAATGKLTELERAARGLAVEWVGDRTVAIAGDTGVSLVELGGGPPRPLPGAEALVSPRKRPRCPEPTVDDTPPVVTDDEEADAAVVEPPPAGESLTPQNR